MLSFIHEISIVSEILGNCGEKSRSERFNAPLSSPLFCLVPAFAILLECPVIRVILGDIWGT